MDKSFAWSYSSLESFETCAWRHKLTKVTKEVSEGQSEEMLWGNRVHKALEHRLVNNTPLPESMQQFEEVAAKVAKAAEGAELEAEQKMSLTKDFRPVSWFDKQTWVRGITDFTINKADKVFIGDWKTGKPKPGSAQLKLTAAMTMHHKPWVNTVINTFVWLKTGSATTEKFTREDIPTIWQEFAPRVQRMEIALAEDKWPKKPGGLCKQWCGVPKHLCEYR